MLCVSTVWTDDRCRIFDIQVNLILCLLMGLFIVCSAGSFDEQQA
jgi:hypothetical protein